MQQFGVAFRLYLQKRRGFVVVQLSPAKPKVKVLHYDRIEYYQISSIRNYRLQYAADLLKSNKGYNVTEVMYQIGIESPSHFSTSFKKLHGVSPSEYLKKK